MTARTIPTLASWAAGSRVTGARLAAMVSYMQLLSSPPMFRMVQGSAQTLSNATVTTVTFDTSVWDTDSGRNGTTPFGYVIPTGMSGRWEFKWALEWNLNTTGARIGQLARNGTRVTGAVTDDSVAANADVHSVIGSMTVACNAGDVMTIVGDQTCGGPLTMQVDANFQPWFEGRLVSLASP